MNGRGFPKAEYEDRTRRAQTMMGRVGLGALMLTTEPEIRYFTGYLTRFWESPSRPWFLIVPQTGKPVAVIPSIGAALMGQCWIDDIRTWPAPSPDDDGVRLLAETLNEVSQGPVGVPTGPESVIRMPWDDFERLRSISGRPFRGDGGIVARLRSVKSEAEIGKIRTACQIAGRAFDRVHEIAKPGRPLSEVFRKFQMLLLEEGADWVPYLAGGAGALGYADVISPASDAPLTQGDVLMLDTGAVWDGYFCDYDRNFVLDTPDPRVVDGHRCLIDAVQAGLDAARPGARACDVYAAMAQICGAGEGAGRLGHGLGMQLTEGLSLTAQDQTVLEPGMVITLEPGKETANSCIIVHEEDIVIRDTGAELLSPLCTSLRVI